MNVHARRFPLLDSLRAVAAILVLTTHAAGPAGAADPSAAARPFATRLGVGVAVFFAISGFLLYRPFAHARLTGGRRPDLRSYALGRFLRIYPAYWVALTAYGIWISAPFVFSDKTPVFYALLQNYWGLGLGGIGAAWSLSVEIGFYVFLPLFALAVARLPGRDPRARLVGEFAAIALLAIVGVCWRGLALSRGWTGGLAPDALPISYFDWFALGMGLAVVSVWIDARGGALPRWLRPVDRFPGAAWAAALAIFVAVALAYDQDSAGYGNARRLESHMLYGLVAAALLLPVAFGDSRRGLLRRVLSNRVLLYLGLISYGIFLWHLAVLEQLQRWHLERIGFIHPYILWPLTTLVLTSIIATASYYLIERPALGLRRRVFGPRADEPAGEALAEPAPATPVG